MGSQASEGIIMVAVSKHTSSIQAVKWMLTNKIVACKDALKLVHVQPVLQFIPQPSGNLVPENELRPDTLATYRRDLHARIKQDLQAQLDLCDASKVQAELIIVEGDDVAKSLLDQALILGAQKFIIGRSSRTFLRTWKGQCIPDIIEEKASEFCTVFVIANGKLRSLKAAKGSAVASGISAPKTYIISEASNGTFLASDDSSRPSLAPQANNSDRQELMKLKYEKLLLKAKKDAIIAKRNAKRLDAYAKEEARKREQAVLEAQLAKLEVAKQARAIEAARLAKEDEAERPKNAEDFANQLGSTGQDYVASLQHAKMKYRQYDFEDLRIATNGFSEENKLGRGGYGSVYKGKLLHTSVAIKVLDKHSAQGQKEFQQEVQFLSHMHHPHIVLLLGACPEQGCLVYEFLANGSLEDSLRHKGNTTPLPWTTRFQIAAEVATALLFLHSLMPEPYVHRDLKPGNILLDQNYVSKLGDLGLAALAPWVLSYDVTEYRETIPVGTPAYIDPAYQTTGYFTPRSDVFAFGLILLQLLTGEGPCGLPKKVEDALSKKTFEEFLDPTAGSWPVHEAAELACIALQCSKLEPRDRPDIQAVLPTLEKLATFSKDYVTQMAWSRQSLPEAELDIPSNFICPISKEIMQNPHFAADGFTYEFAAIKTWIEDCRVSPITHMKLRHKDLIPNHNLRLQILEWKRKLPYEWKCLI